MILCRVVDNYGDIGFVYRLARSLSLLEPSLKLALVVSNMESFASMAPGIDSSKPRQEYCGWTVLDWNDAAVCTRYCKGRTPQFVLECFQCGRPDWLEKLLFEDNKDGSLGVVTVINVEYLTAEAWADDFHLLKGGTRSRFVKKWNFMPGFSPRTGGLVLDQTFLNSLANHKNAIEQLAPFLPGVDLSDDSFKVVFFSYTKNCTGVVRALEQFGKIRPVRVFVAPGLGREPFMSVLPEVTSCSYALLPQLPQTAWDALLTLSDFNFVRGEDSFSRAALCGVPFVWDAYRQDGEFQMVKADAFVQRLKQFSSECRITIGRLFALYNRCYEVVPGEEADTVLDQYRDFPRNGDDAQKEIEELLHMIFCKYDLFRTYFAEFADRLIVNGDLGAHLLEFMGKLSTGS